MADVGEDDLVLRIVILDLISFVFRPCPPSNSSQLWSTVFNIIWPLVKGLFNW